MKLLDVFRFCKQCAKSALFAEIGEDGLCPKCRDAAARKEAADAAELQKKAVEAEDRRKRAAQALRFCSVCAKNGLFVDIGEDGLCPNCREELARKAEEEADRKRKAAQTCHKCHKNGLMVEITRGCICDACRAKYPRIRDELRGATVTYQKWFLWNFDFIRRCRKRFIAFDVETTGLRTYADRVIEVSAVIFENFEPVAEFSTLVNPEIDISPGASAVNGIYNKDLIGAPYTHQAIAELCDFIGPEVLTGEIPMVAHNADFDAKFLLDEFQICGISANLFISDTLYMSQWVIPELYRHRLCDVAEHFGIVQAQAHRAADDARVCGEIFVRMLQIREARLEEKKSELLPVELKIAQWLKTEVESEELNTQLYSVKLGKTFCAIKCVDEVLRIKARGKKSYVIVPASWPIPDGLTTEPTTKSEGEMNVRLLFADPEDIYPLRDHLVARYRAALEHSLKKINSSVRDFQFASENAAREISL